MDTVKLNISASDIENCVNNSKTVYVNSAQIDNHAVYIGKIKLVNDFNSAKARVEISQFLCNAVLYLNYLRNNQASDFKAFCTLLQSEPFGTNVTRLIISSDDSYYYFYITGSFGSYYAKGTIAITSIHDFDITDAGKLVNTVDIVPNNEQSDVLLKDLPKGA